MFPSTGLWVQPFWSARAIAQPRGLVQLWGGGTKAALSCHREDTAALGRQQDQVGGTQPCRGGMAEDLEVRPAGQRGLWRAQAEVISVVPAQPWGLVLPAPPCRRGD